MRRALTTKRRFAKQHRRSSHSRSTTTILNSRLLATVFSIVVNCFSFVVRVSKTSEEIFSSPHAAPQLICFCILSQGDPLCVRSPGKLQLLFRDSDYHILHLYASAWFEAVALVFLDLIHIPIYYEQLF